MGVHVEDEEQDEVEEVEGDGEGGSRECRGGGNERGG